MTENEKWLQWAVELQSIAQAGITYSKDAFDLERFRRLREIAAEMVSHQADLPIEKARNLFCSETGYQTPKIDCRAAVFEGEKILLVQERDGAWALPGGWVDVHLSVKENVIKECREEAGLLVKADRVIAVQDREKHNQPAYAWKICKIFVLCTALGGSFEENIETTATAYFALNELPKLAVEKTNEEQIRMCFDARRSENWQTLLD